jgi:hypothetical protein
LIQTLLSQKLSLKREVLPVHVEPELVVIDWVKDIPFMSTLVSYVTHFPTLLIFAWNGIGSMLDFVKIHASRHVRDQIKRSIMFVGLALMSFYILGSRNRTTGSISIITNSTDAEITIIKPDLRYSQLEEKIDTLFLLLQNQMNPVISNLKNQGEKLHELEQALETKTESSPALLQALVSLNEELDSKIKQMGEKIMGLSQKSSQEMEILKQDLSDSFQEKLHQSVRDAIQHALTDVISENPSQFSNEKAALLSFLDHKLLQSMALTESDSMYIFKTFGPDYSLRTSGASIVTQNTSPSFLQDKDVIVNGLHKIGSPLEILDPSTEPGHCWGMKGATN